MGGVLAIHAPTGLTVNESSFKPSPLGLLPAGTAVASQTSACDDKSSCQYLARGAADHAVTSTFKLPIEWKPTLKPASRQSKSVRQPNVTSTIAVPPEATQ